MNKRTDMPPDTDAGSEHAALLDKVARFYHKALPNAQKARGWLKRYGLNEKDLAERWLLGAATGRLLRSLPTEADEPARSLGELGILTPAGTEFFLNCITAPLHDGDGGVVAMAGCAMADGVDRFLPAAPTALWNAPAARLYSELILATNLLDGLSLHRAGFPHACAVVGPHLKPGDVTLLHEAGARRLLLLGPDAACRLLMEQLGGFECRCHPLSVNAFMVRSGLPELVAEVDRLAAASAAPAGDGRTEPLEQGFAVSFGRRRYEVLGIEKSARRLKITIKTGQFGKLHVDTLDLYHARSRKSLLRDLSCFFVESPQVIEGDLTKLIRLCEDFSPQSRTDPVEPAAAMSEEERREAEAFGRSEDLEEHIVRDFGTCGLVGEHANKLLCYLAALSRKTDDPISVLILSSSGAGKSALQDAAVAFCPPEDVVKLTSLTGKALFYKGAKSLRHKVLALEEEAGARQASYALRNLISAGELVIETTVKDLGSGRLTTMQNRVEGPTAVLITTTNPDVDPETRSRFFVTGVDESREQTRAILESQRQRRTWEGRTERAEREAVIRKHWNFQRLLRSVGVVNPYAGGLSYQDDRLQGRRDQPKYLNLINTVAFLRQMRKEARSFNGREYVEVDESDLAFANELAAEVLGRSLDELNPVSRELLLQIERMVEGRAREDTRDGQRPRTADITFTRRDIREHTGWPHARVERYLGQLVELEYLLTRAGRNGRRYVYSLAYEGQGKDGESFVLGLAAQPTGTFSAASHGLLGTFSAASQSADGGQDAPVAEVAKKPSHSEVKG